MIDLEAEAAAVRERSVELAGLLDSAQPLVDRTAIRAAKAEAARLGAVATAARREVAVRVAAGLDAGPGVTVGRSRPIRRVKTDSRGRDLDGTLKGRAAITPQLIAAIEFDRDVLAPTIESAYRQALEARPWQPALLAACHGHISVLQARRSFGFEGGTELLGAIERYEAAYGAIRAGAVDGQNVATAAIERLRNLEREKAEAIAGTDDQVIRGFIASAVAGAMPEQLVGVDGSTVGAPISGQPVAVTR